MLWPHSKSRVNVGYYYYLLFSLCLCFKQRNYLEEFEYAPLLATSMCFSFLCPLLGHHPQVRVSKPQLGLLQAYQQPSLGAREAFPHHPFGTLSISFEVVIFCFV